MSKTLFTASTAAVLTLGVASWTALAQPAQDQAADTPAAAMHAKADGSSHGMMSEMPVGMMDCCRMMETEVSPEGPAAMLGAADRLGLSDEQKDHLEAIRQETRERARAVLTDEQQAKLGELRDGSTAMRCPMMQMMKADHPNGEAGGGHSHDAADRKHTGHAEGGPRHGH